MSVLSSDTDLSLAAAHRPGKISEDVPSFLSWIERRHSPVA